MSFYVFFPLPGEHFSLYFLSHWDNSYLFLKIYPTLNLHQDRFDALLLVPTEPVLCAEQFIQFV